MTANGLPQLSIQVAFTGTKSGVTVSANPNDPAITPIWTDITKRVVSFKVRRGKQADLDESEAADNSLRLRNSDGMFDPDSTTSPWAGYVLPYRAYQIKLTVGANTYMIASGFVEAWDQTWDLHGVRGWCDLTLTDAFGLLSQMALLSCLMSEVVLDNPMAYWPLAEPSSVTQGQNVAVTSVGPLATTNFGNGGGSVAFGATTLTALVGAGASNGETSAVTGNTTGVLISNTIAGPGGQAAALAAATDNLNHTVGTIEGWITGLTDPNGGTGYGFPLIGAWAGWGGAGIGIFCDSSGHAQIGVPQYGSVNVLSSATVAVGDGGLHHLACTFDGTNITLYVDGAQVAQVAQGSYVAAGQVQAPFNALYNFPTCTFAHIAFYTTALSAARIAAHHNAGVNAFPESTSSRFNRLLSYAPWWRTATVPSGNSNMAGLTDCAGKSALQALQDVVRVEQGNMYVSAAGAVTFENRNNRATQVSAVWRFTDNPTNSNTDIPYGESPTVVRDPTTIYNALIVQRPGGGEYRFFDQNSMLAYFPRAHPDNPFELPIDTDQNLEYAAQFIVGKYARSYARVTGIEIDATSNPSLYALVAQMEIGQRVTFVRTPREATSPISQDFFIEQVEHTWDAASPGSYKVAVEMSPAGWSAFGILTAQRGTLASSTTASATSFVVNYTPSAGNTLQSDGWTKSAVPYIVFNDGANAETLAVASMSYGTNQVTITTTTGAAHSHSSGVTVSEAFGSVPAYNTYDTAATLDGLHKVAW